MANTNNATEQARVRAIAEKFKSIASQLRGDLDAKFEALDAAQMAAGKERARRLVLLADIAKASCDGDWSISDIDTAADQARDMLAGNGDPDARRSINALRVLASELKTPAHPFVRARFTTILCAVEDAWENEEQLKAQTTKADQAELDMPVHKWRARIYQAVIGACVAVKDGRAVIADADDVTNWAISQDPDYDPKRAAARIRAFARDWKKISAIFPVAGYADVQAVLERTNKAALEQSQARHAPDNVTRPMPATPRKPILRVVQPVAGIAPIPGGPQPVQAAGAPSETISGDAQPEVIPTASPEGVIEGVFDPMGSVDDILDNAAA